MDNIKAAEELALQFHQTYERLAPSFGYETRPYTKVFHPESNNGKLMIAVCSEILTSLSTQSPKWVKASERLWDYGKKVIVRYGNEVHYTQYHNITYCVPIESIEWLDESPSSTHPLQEKIDGLREALAGVIKSWDSRSHEREEKKNTHGFDYWSPVASLVDSSAIAAAREALETYK